MSSTSLQRYTFRCSASALVNHSAPPKSTLFAVGYFSRIIHLRPDVLIGHLLHAFSVPYYHITIIIVLYSTYSSQVVKVGFRINTRIMRVLQRIYIIYICVCMCVYYGNTTIVSKGLPRRAGKVGVKQRTCNVTAMVRRRRSCWFFGIVNLTSVCRRDRSPWWTWLIGHVELRYSKIQHRPHRCRKTISHPNRKPENNRRRETDLTKHATVIVTPSQIGNMRLKLYTNISDYALGHSRVIHMTCLRVISTNDFIFVF